MSTRTTIDKLIARSFDDDPEVRKKVAIELGKSDDPGAILALAELSYDRDPEVAEVARKVLAERKKKQPQMLPFHELFEGVSFAGGKKEEEKKKETEKKVLEPIEKIFKKKFKDQEKAKKAFKSFISTLAKEKGTPTTQEFLTAYLESVESINESKEPEEKKVEKVDIPTKAEEVETSVEEIEEVIGTPLRIDQIGSEAAEVERDELFTIEEKKALERPSGEPNVFGMAYNQFLALEGDERLMKKQAKLLEDFFKKQVKLAYDVARRKFKEIRLTDISDIRDGMRNITTDLLEVVDVRHLRYMRTKTKEDTYTRVVLRDEEGKEGVLYLFEGRGEKLQPGMRLRLEKAKAKTFKFSGETALAVDKRSKVIVEF